jgi:hypothetical protein
VLVLIFIILLRFSRRLDLRGRETFIFDLIKGLREAVSYYLSYKKV